MKTFISLNIVFSIDLCPKPNITDNPLSKKSHVEDFTDPMPGLFQALTAEPDPHERWLTFTFPVDFDMSLFTPKHENKYTMSMYYNFSQIFSFFIKINLIHFNSLLIAMCYFYNLIYKYDILSQ